MKGFIAMQKMDLIDDEYIREAEIDAETPVVISEEGRFWKRFARFMNSPVGVAMLCAVVSLSVLAAIVMVGTGKWEEWFPPAGTGNEQTSATENTDAPPTQDETLPPIETLDAKSFVPQFYQALKDKDMIGKIPDPAVNGGLIFSDDPTYIVKEENIHNTTPLEIYEETGALIFDAGVMVYLWMDGEIYILNQRVVWGSGFTGAVLCDYDQNGTEDIFCGYITSLSGVWYTDFVVFDVTDKALRHNLRRVPSDNSSMVVGYMIFCNYGMIQKRTTDGKDYYDLYEAGFKQEGDSFVLTPEKLYITLTPSPQGLLPISGGEYQDPIPTINLIPNTDINKITQCLVDHGFTGGLGQSEFIDGVLGKFSYEGQPLHEFPITVGDGDLEDGGFVSVANFYESYLSFDHYAEHRPGGENSYSYSLATQVPLEGFALPYDMEFGMTFAEAWEIMGLGEMKDYGSGETVLYRVGNETLTLSKNFTDPETLTDTYTVKLIFSQTATEGEGTRSVAISFGEDLTLREIKISVSTKGNASFEESTPPPITDIAMQMYEAAIHDEIYVFDERLGEAKLKSLRFPSNDTSLDAYKLLQKAILDVDQDGVSEYVIQSPDHEYIILRCYNGKVFSYRLDACDFYKFNTDGTFYWCHSPESGERECGLSKIIFVGEAINIKSIYSLTYSPNPAQYEYFVEGKAVTEDAYGHYRNQNIIRYEEMKFSQFEMSCSYPITAEQAWNLANAYWDHQDGNEEASAGTIWIVRIKLIDTPNAETDDYRFAFQEEWYSGGGLEGYECMPPHTIREHDQILVNAFTGEITASTYDPNGKGVSVEEAIEIAKNDCEYIDFDKEENRYRVEYAVNEPAPDHIYVIVIQEYVVDHYSVYAEKWVDKNTGEIISPYYISGK
ncbi:MAG: hypothetical protein IJW00_01500 [Clostridia bacterium]|nr:hypothetical protein [Clostridia bacterium]